MKFILHEGIVPPTNGKMLPRQRPISMYTLQASRSHSSKTPKSAHISPVTPSALESETPTHTTPTSRVILEVPQVQTDPQTDRVTSLLANIQKRVDEMVTLLYSTNNHVQMQLKSMENQLEAIQQKLDNSL